MTKTGDKHPKKKLPTRTPAAEAACIEREARLAAALRDNLRKRKTQARARAGDRRPDETGGQEP